MSMITSAVVAGFISNGYGIAGTATGAALCADSGSGNIDAFLWASRSGAKAVVCSASTTGGGGPDRTRAVVGVALATWPRADGDISPRGPCPPTARRTTVASTMRTTLYAADAAVAALAAARP